MIFPPLLGSVEDRDDRSNLVTVGLLAVLFGQEVIGIEEFMSVVIGLEGSGMEGFEPTAEFISALMRAYGV